MINKFRWFLWFCGIMLIGNFIMLMAYGDTLQSTHLFIVRGTVFYPFAWLNLIAGMILIGLLVIEAIIKNRKS
jgi:hypothetical protein